MVHLLVQDVGDNTGNGSPDGLTELSNLSTSSTSGPASDVSSSVSTTSSTASMDQMRRVIAQMKNLKIAFSPEAVKPVESQKVCHTPEPSHVGTDSPLTPFQRMKVYLESQKGNKVEPVKETKKVEAPRDDTTVKNGQSSSLVLPQYAT